jgi:hypothetical protein
MPSLSILQSMPAFASAAPNTDAAAAATDQFTADDFTELLYDTASHGATNKAFHDACDLKGPTIGVFTSDEEQHIWGWYLPYPAPKLPFHILRSGLHQHHGRLIANAKPLPAPFCSLPADTQRGSTPSSDC